MIEIYLFFSRIEFETRPVIEILVSICMRAVRGTGKSRIYISGRAEFLFLIQF